MMGSFLSWGNCGLFDAKVATRIEIDLALSARLPWTTFQIPSACEQNARKPAWCRECLFLEASSA